MPDHELKTLGAPEFRGVNFSMLGDALRNGWRDMRRAPGYAFVFAGVYVFAGLVMAVITLATGKSYWLVFGAVGFPLVGPFAAVGLYEVSHRLSEGRALVASEIFSVIAHQRRRQLPSICAIIIMVFLFWFFLAHMIFALFLGLSTMTNVSSSLGVFMTREGLGMLVVGSVVGALFALLIYSITVISLPLLLDREVDFVTAMLKSLEVVIENPVPMLTWAALIAVLTFLALVPAFLGLFIVLPLLGHATWHLYKLASSDEAGAGEIN